MLKKRLIPCLLLQNGLLVRSETFSIHQILGNPIHEVERFNEWSVDELVYLDITRDDAYDLRRDDQKVKTLVDPLQILDAVSKTCFMPLTFGGRIRTIDDMRVRFARGADKITLNTAAIDNPDLLVEGARTFGTQAMVISIDVRRHPDGTCEVFADGGRRATGREPTRWAKELEAFGAGEILLNSIDRDGTARGYDLELIGAVARATSIPIIACGGVGRYEDFAKGIQAGASAVSAANIFHFKELSDRNAKRTMRAAGIDVRI
jgi:imidazole glycerol-phosphate synthase subunit HisF